jgi:hypothetical protein
MNKKIISLLVLILAFSLQLYATPLNIAEHQWLMQQNTGDPGSITIRENCLQIKFDATVQKEFQFGHQRVRQSVYSIYLKKPIQLEKKQSRIFFTAQGIRQMYRRTSDSYNIFPVIRDENGEVFTYTAYPEAYLGQPAKWNIYPKNYQRWRSNYFYTNEAGGATTDIFYAEGGDNNNWPDGELEFLGFKLQVRSKKDKQKLSDTITIQEISFGTKIIAEYEPYVFAGTVLSKKGKYSFGYEVRNAFQATPITEGTVNIDFDPAQLQSGFQKIAVPLGGRDNYWVRYAITDEVSQELIAHKKTRWQVEGDLGATQQKIDLKSAPKVGYIRINPDHHSNGVYARGEAFDVIVRLFSKKLTGDFKLDWQLLAYNRGMDGKNYDTVLASSSKQVHLDADGQRDLTLSLKKVDHRDAYRLKLTLQHEGNKVDSTTYLLGYQTDFSKPYTSRVGLKPNRHEVKKSTYQQTTFHHPSFSLPNSLEEDLKGFATYLRESRRMADKTNIMIDVRDIEILPGVFNFYILDKYLDLIADHGMKATVSFRHYDDNGEYNWQKYTRQRSFDNIEINQHYYGSFDFSDKRTTEAWKNATKKVYLRYRKHPAFLGYYFYSVAGELSVIDKPWHGINVGHNAVSTQAFKEYLKHEIKLDLPALNKRWKTELSSWDDVKVPSPTFELGAQPDLRMEWIDFCKFKRYQDLRFWYETIVKDVRSYDDFHVIVCHNGQTIPIKNFGLQDYSHNGGNHWKVNEKSLQMAWEKGTGQITEPHNPHHWATHGDPEERGWVLDHSVYCMLAQGGGGCANLGTYWLNRPERLVDHYGTLFAYDRVEKFKPILNELVQTRLVMDAPKIGTMYDYSTLYAKHRTIFYHRTKDLQRWLELLKTDGLAHTSLTLANGEWSPDIDQFKLIVPNALDEVMDIKNIEKLSELVSKGARLLLPANVGRYCPQKSGTDFTLLEKLGINPPSGAYNKRGVNIKAVVSSNNPIFKIGHELPFYTTEQQQIESQGDIVKTKAGFWKWPYRWLPVSNYFGYFSENKSTNGQVIARFEGGAVAVSIHKHGKGEVVVLWGTPDYKPESYKGFMSKIAKWAGATKNVEANPMKHMFELSPMDERKNHYAVIYEEESGNYVQKIPNVPEGLYFVDDMVSNRRYGTYTASEIRTSGIPITVDEDSSPLRIIRCVAIDKNKLKSGWIKKFRTPNEL